MIDPLPPAAMPEQVRSAIYGHTPTADEPDYKPPANPWTPKVNSDGRLEYVCDDDEEVAMQAPIQQIKKLFSPDPVRIAPKLGDLAPLPVENLDDDEREYCTPAAIKKLFHPDVTTVASGSSSDFSKQAATPAPQEDWDSPLAKRSSSPSAELTYKTRRDDDGYFWREGYDAAGELQTAFVIHDDADLIKTESLLLLRRRVKAKLAESQNQ